MRNSVRATQAERRALRGLEGAGVKLISVVSSHHGKADMPCGHQSTYDAPCFGVLQLRRIRSKRAITRPASSASSTSLRQPKPIWSFQIFQIARTLINLLPPSQRKLIKIGCCELQEFLREMRSLTKCSSTCLPPVSRWSTIDSGENE